DGVNLYSPQRGARGPSSYGGGPRALFVCAHPRGRRARRGDGGGRSAAGRVGDAQGVAVPRASPPRGASDRLLAGRRVPRPRRGARPRPAGEPPPPPPPPPADRGPGGRGGGAGEGGGGGAPRGWGPPGGAAASPPRGAPGGRAPGGPPPRGGGGGAGGGKPPP